MTNQTIKRKSFILHQDSLEILNELTDEQAGKLIKAIFRYQKTGDFGNTDQFTRIILTPFISQFKRDDEGHLNSIIQGKLGNLKKYHPEIYLRVVSQEIPLEEGEKLAYPEKLVKLSNHRPPITPDQGGSLNVNVSVNVNKNKNVNKSFSPEVEKLTDGLKFVLEAKLNKNLQTNSWKKEIRKLLEIDLKPRTNAVEDVKRAIQAIADNFGKEFFPVIQSGSSLREKFTKIENYLGKSQSSKTQSNQDIYNNLRGKFENE